VKPLLASVRVPSPTKEDDMFATTIRTALAAVIAVVVLAPSAFAGGEPKNQPPFTQRVPQPTTTIVVERPTGGFHWVDALIGAGAMLGTGLAGGGAIAVRSNRRAQPSTAF
jgi:hypothetical protein